MAEGAPRWLDREAVAAYVSVRVDYVARLVKAGKLPVPSYHVSPNSPRRDRVAVDNCFEGRAGSPSRKHEEIVQAGIESILLGDMGGRRRRG